MKHVVEQLKWIYAGLAGLCAAYFISLLGSNQHINCSIPLFISAICFGVDLPIFTAFTLAHIGFVEKNIAGEIVKDALSWTWVIFLTRIAFLLLCVAFVALIFHFSLIIGIIFIVSIIISYSLLKYFFKKLGHNIIF